MSGIRSYVPLSSWGEQHLSVEMVARFQYDCQIGNGGNSDIFLEAVSGKDLAVKVAREGSDPSEMYHGWNPENWLVRREAAFLSLFSCDQIVKPHGVWMAQDRLYLALDRYHCSLEDMFRFNHVPPIDMGLAIYFCSEIGKALEFIHKMGFVHGDIKPQNVLLDPLLTGVPLLPKVVLCDFSYMRRYQALLPSEAEGCVVGSPLYMAPEVAAGHKTAPFYRDMFALGATLYRMLGGSLRAARTPLETLGNRTELRDAMMDAQDVEPRARHLLQLLVDPNGGIQDGMHLMGHIRQHYGWYVYEDSCMPEVWRELFPPRN